jgi:hypothetical protein
MVLFRPTCSIAPSGRRVLCTGVLCGLPSCVGLDVLHNDDHLPLRALRDRVPDRQAVRWKMETVGTRQRVFRGKGVGERRDRLFEQMKDRLAGGVPKWLRQSFKFIPGSVWEAKDPVTH